MSMKSWMKEFYPVPADSREALENPITHSLRKWRGLTPENLAKHRLKHIPHTFTVHGRSLRFEVNGDSCALCYEYHNSTPNCSECPLYQVRQGYACDQTRDNEKARDNEKDNPFFTFIATSDPLPMIHALEQALEEYPE